MMMRSLLFAFSFICVAFCATGAVGKAQAPLSVVEGKIILPEGAKLPPETEVQVVLESGSRLVGYPTPDGRFKVYDVPDGAHTLDVLTPNWIFPAVKLLTGARLPSPVSASLPEIPGVPALSHPLLLRPSVRAEYFDTRKPINVLAFLKTPYGMMAGFMVFSMFLLPKLKVDPEEYRRVMGDPGRAQTD